MDVPGANEKALLAVIHPKRLWGGLGRSNRNKHQILAMTTVIQKLMGLGK